jgi:uncharacterized protein YdeI (YjbR/CyaY-like superfamily)
VKPRFEDQLGEVYAVDRQAWRLWLETNHQKAIGVWLVYYKVKSGQPSVKYGEAVKEALCFGWIDSKVNAVDGDRYRQIFTPRKPKSVWSKLNKQYLEELTAAGLMTEMGLTKVKAAQADGSWTSLDAIEALVVPADLQQALALNEAAAQNFAHFSNSVKKNILVWVEGARRSETRLSRIEKTVAAAAANRNPLVRSQS